MPDITNSLLVKNGERASLSSQSPKSSQPKAFRFVILACIGLLCSLFFISLPFVAEAQWTASKFEVIPIDPWEKVKAANNGVIPQNSSLPPLNLLAPPGTATNPALADAKAFLNELGMIYSTNGLKEPVFDPMVNSTTRGVFRFTFPGSLGDPDTTDIAAFYISAICIKNFKKNWMALNSNASGGIDQYKTIAHELFHAISDQYAWEKNSSQIPLFCGEETDPHLPLEAWLSEGTADAAGFFLMEKKMNGKGAPLAIKDRKFYGVRPYDVPLQQTDAWQADFVKTRIGGTFAKPKDLNRWFGYRTSSFWRFLMDRWDSSPTYDPKRLQALSEGFMKRVGPDDVNGWIDWVAHGVGGNWGPFPHAYGEFLAEFAAWPGGKYPNNKLPTDFLLEQSFGGCDQIVLSYKKKNTEELTLEPFTPSGYALYPIAGRCIQVTINNVKIGATLKLELEVDAKSKDIAEQLVLGFAREEHEEVGVDQNGMFFKKTVLADNCYTHARNNSKHDFPCLFYGKVQDVTGTKNTNGIRTWRFESRKAKHSTLITTFVLANVHPDEASATKAIKALKGTVGFSKSTGKTTKGALGIPESFNLGELPDATIPRRQALYGIKKKSAISTGYSMNLSPIQVAALDDAGNKTETYAITPLEPVAFGQTGPFKAMVMVGNQGAQSGLPPRIIGSTYCATDSQPGSIGTITRSDDEILEIAIDTPLCQLPFDIMACKDGCPVVDHFQGTLSLPFGWRYFAENEVEDLVTPGVLLDIDRYHHEVFGEPLQGLSSNGTGGSGSGSGSNGSGGGTPNGNGGSQGGTVIPPCDCSCEGYEQHKKKLKEIKASKIPDFNSLRQMLQCDQQCAKPFRDCRRAQKKH